MRDRTIRDIGLDRSVEYLLRSHGYSTFESVKRATDSDLLAIPGIGQHRLNAIRTATLLHDDEPPNYLHNLDALLGAIFHEDEATRTRIMAKAKELESGG